MKQAFVVLMRTYSRNEVFQSKWKTVQAESMAEAVKKAGRDFMFDGESEPEIQKKEGVEVAISSGEEHLIIAGRTKQDVRVAYTIYSEDNVGY